MAQYNQDNYILTVTREYVQGFGMLKVALQIIGLITFNFTLNFISARYYQIFKLLATL